MPRTQNFFTSIHFGRGTVIHRRLREAFKTLPRHRMNNCGNRIRNEAGFWGQRAVFIGQLLGNLRFFQGEPEFTPSYAPCASLIPENCQRVAGVKKFR